MTFRWLIVDDKTVTGTNDERVVSAIGNNDDVEVFVIDTQENTVIAGMDADNNFIGPQIQEQTTFVL